METDPALLKINLSHYPVYQMLDYVSSSAGFKLIQKQIGDLHLFKTAPYLDSLYNYAHILMPGIDATQISLIRDFFQGEPFRIQISENKSDEQLLIDNGFYFKDSGYIMETGYIDDSNDNEPLPQNIEIRPVTSTEELEYAKAIFAKAFNCTAEQRDNKFAFSDPITLDKDDNHINYFILYANSQAVSTGAYYAFDRCSVENIGTLISARGHGYATLIVRHLLQEAKNLGYDKACLVASEAGARVYKKLGFKALKKIKTYKSYIG